MNRHLLPYVVGCILLVGLLVVEGGIFWDAQPSPDAWFLDRTEQILFGVSPGQEVKVIFHLKNTSRRPRRILGSDAC